MSVPQHLLVSLDNMLLRRALANASSAVRENEARAAARAAAERAITAQSLASRAPAGAGRAAR